MSDVCLLLTHENVCNFAKTWFAHGGIFDIELVVEKVFVAALTPLTPLNGYIFFAIVKTQEKDI